MYKPHPYLSCTPDSEAQNLEKDILKQHSLKFHLSCISTNNQGQTIEVSKHRHRSCGSLTFIESKESQMSFVVLSFSLQVTPSLT